MKNIFVHGLGQTEESWASCFDKGENNYYPNLKSLIGLKEVTFNNLYAMFSAYCDKFSNKVNLVGISLGGMLALKYTIQNPNKVNSLVLIGTQYKIPQLLFNMQGFVFKCLPEKTFNGMGFSKKDFLTLTNSMKKIDFTNNLSKIECKTLIICGEKDYANKKATFELNKKLKNSTISIIPNAKHEVNIDSKTQLNNELVNFITIL